MPNVNLVRRIVTGFIEAIFTPLSILGLELWGKFNDITTLNAKMGADFVAANSEYLSSTSTDFQKTDEDFSLGGWIYFDSLGNNNNFFSKFGASGNRSFYLFKDSSNVAIAGISSDGTNFTTVGTTTLSGTTWHFLVFVYDSVNDLLKISVDGATFETASHSSGAYNSTVDFMLGNANSGNYHDGRMDGTFFYDKALSQAQVSALYNSGNGIAYDNATADMLTSLVSWWELNELSGTRFDRVASNNLTDNNTVGYALGKIQENAIQEKTVASFTASNSEYLNTDDSTFKKTDSDFSIGCWVYIDSPLAGTSTHYFFDKWGAVGNLSYALAWNNSTTKFGFFTSNDGTAFTQLYSDADSVGDWYFVVGVHDSVANEIKLSVNGETFKTTAFSGGLFDNTTGLIIGSHPTTPTANGLTGDMTNAFFYDKALSQAEVNSLYALGTLSSYSDLTGSLLTSLTAWWDLDEASGNRADSSGGGYTLTDNNTVASDLIYEGSVWRFVDQSDNAFNVDQDTAADQGAYLNGKEILFDGASDFYDLTSVLTPLTGTTVGTICVWVKPIDATPTSFENIISFGDTNADTAIQIYNFTDGTFRVYVRIGSVDKWLINTDAAAFSDNTWTHVAIVQDGVTPVLYVNGVAVAQTDLINTDLTSWFSAAPLIDNCRLGCRNYATGGNTSFYSGALAEPLIYNTNLTASQITDIYNYSLASYS